MVRRMSKVSRIGQEAGSEMSLPKKQPRSIEGAGSRTPGETHSLTGQEYVRVPGYFGKHVVVWSLKRAMSQ